MESVSQLPPRATQSGGVTIVCPSCFVPRPHTGDERHDETCPSCHTTVRRYQPPAGRFDERVGTRAYSASAAGIAQNAWHGRPDTQSAPAAGTVRATPAGRSRLAREIEAPTWLLVVIGVFILTCGSLSSVFLRSQASVSGGFGANDVVPGTDLTFDFPDGWTVRDASVPEVAGVVAFGASEAATTGLVLSSDDSRLFVSAAPNSAALTTVPALSETLGTLAIRDQRVVAHGLGAAREFSAMANTRSDDHGVRATVIVTADQIVVVGVEVPGTLDPTDIAAYEVVLHTLRHRTAGTN